MHLKIPPFTPNEMIFSSDYRRNVPFKMENATIVASVGNRFVSRGFIFRRVVRSSSA